MGLVEENADPERLGRLKIRVPTVYGVSGEIGTDELPWAIPFGLPAGGSSVSGGISWLPTIGDQVTVQFLDGEPEKPVWAWCMQTRAQAEKLKLHHYGTGDEGEVAEPDRSILSRYGHSLEISGNEVILTTSQGYQIRLGNSGSESGGSSSLQTPAGQRIELNDSGKSVVIQGLDSTVISGGSTILNAASNALIRAGGTFTVMAGSTLITIKDKSVVLCTGSGASVIVDPEGNVSLLSAEGASVSLDGKTVQVASPDGTGVVVENGKMSISSTQMAVNSSAVAFGTDALYAPIMLTPSLMTWILGHTHISATPGSPTGPPIPLNPLFPQDSASTRVKMT